MLYFNTPDFHITLSEYTNYSNSFRQSVDFKKDLFYNEWVFSLPKKGLIHMKLIFIRHAEPDYTIDSLTEKGWREAELLSQRIIQWKVTDFYQSPLGRAQDTASLTLKKNGRTAKTLDWLEEYAARVELREGVNIPMGAPHSITQQRTGTCVAWDLMPSYWTRQPELMDLEAWSHNELMKTGDNEAYYKNVADSLDDLLKTYGYERDGRLYRVQKDLAHPENEPFETTIVCFCHLGISFACISHLLNMAPHQMWQGFFTAPSSVTVLSTEEREEGFAQFRCQMLGDTSHLRMHGEPVSHMGYFTTPFQG